MTTEVIAEYDNPVEAPDASIWAARACGRPLDGKWEGWIEFIPLTEGHSPVRTPRETTQADRDEAKRWAEGVSVTYLEGAFARAIERPFVLVTESAPPLFDTPAPTIGATNVAARLHGAILDPFAVFAQGEQLLTNQLAALDTHHVRDIVQAYDIAPIETALFASRADLVAYILSAVRARQPA